MKFLIPLISAFLVLRYISKPRIPDSSIIPSDWLKKPSGYMTYNIPEGFFSVSEKNALQWNQKAMLWGVAFGIDPALILGCIFAESAGNPNAKRWESNVKQYSYGLMQLLWSTAQLVVGWLKSETYIPKEFVLTASNIHNVNLNIMLGSRYLQYQYKRYSYINAKDRAKYMFAGYNAGTARVNSTGQFVNSKGETTVNVYVLKCISASQKFRYYLNNQYPAYLTMFPKSIWQYSGI